VVDVIIVIATDVYVVNVVKIMIIVQLVDHLYLCMLLCI
jgi:hypothetical protein